jgi:HEAT repeat protein
VVFHKGTGKRHVSGRTGAGVAARLLSCLSVSWALALALTGGGCGFWDEFRARDYSVKAFFVKENPLVVLRDSSDGNKRARAFAELREPKQNGGSQEDQDTVVRILVTAASSEPQAWCRLKAIESLATFKDPRAVQGLKDAYYKADNFTAETRTVIRRQSLVALGKIGNPEAIDLLVNVVQAPPPEPSANSEQDKLYYLDERLAAAEALASFKKYQSTDALLQVLKTEKDPSLRDQAHSSLQVATGKRLPPDAKAWDDLLNPPGPGGATPRDAVAGQKKATLGQPVIQAGSRDEK